MKTLYSTEPEPPRVFLAGIRSGGPAKPGDEAPAAELAALADTLGLNIAGTEILSVREQHPRYGMGSGKAEELAEKARQAGAACIIFDREISPSQQRNWEALSGMAVLDRQELIIRIFADRASTREAELQAELARLLYTLPRLSHKYIDLSRQRGGRYGTRGSGETRLETDKRRIRERIGLLKKEIEEVRRNRNLQRRQRERQGTPVCALVGYTNAGKSSLHRALTGSEVLVENRLFATLDPTARRVSRLTPRGRKNIIIVDTVGFIRALPHSLVDAFRATLEEAARADVLVHVLDAADPARREQGDAALGVLQELGAGRIPRITVFNKADLLDPGALAALEEELRTNAGADHGCCAVSAKDRQGLENLWNMIEKTLKF